MKVVKHTEDRTQITMNVTMNEYRAGVLGFAALNKLLIQVKVGQI